jgi:hypothetical protein
MHLPNFGRRPGEVLMLCFRPDELRSDQVGQGCVGRILLKPPRTTLLRCRRTDARNAALTDSKTQSRRSTSRARVKSRLRTMSSTRNTPHFPITPLAPPVQLHRLKYALRQALENRSGDVRARYRPVEQCCGALRRPPRFRKSFARSSMVRLSSESL